MHATPVGDIGTSNVEGGGVEAHPRDQAGPSRRAKTPHNLPLSLAVRMNRRNVKTCRRNRACIPPTNDVTEPETRKTELASLAQYGCTRPLRSAALALSPLVAGRSKRQGRLSCHCQLLTPRQQCVHAHTKLLPTVCLRGVLDCLRKLRL